MKVRVDRERCQGHGVCSGEAPEVFALDDDGELEVLQERPPEAQREKVENALRFCPTQALSISDD